MGWVSYVICPETDTRGRYYESGELKMAVDPAQAKVIIDRYQATMHQPLDVGDERLSSNPPLLAHYTSVEVAEQIIKNEEIWLSHPFYMNDLEELRFGMLLGIQRFPAHVETLNETPQRKKALLDAFAHFVGYMNEQTLVDTYVLRHRRHFVYVAQLRQSRSRRCTRFQHSSDLNPAAGTIMDCEGSLQIADRTHPNA